MYKKKRISSVILMLLASCTIIMSTKRKIIKAKLATEKEWDLLPYIKTDLITRTFIITIALISISVMIFSKFYLENEKKKKEFNMLTAIFVTSIFIIIASPNIVSIILG